MVESPRSATQVQLFISCRKLRNVETFSFSDPFVEIFEKATDNKWVFIGKTEIIWDNLNPDFITNFILDYYFEKQQFLLFKVFDANMEGKRKVKGLQLGEVECTLGEMVGAKGQQVIKTLKIPESRRSAGNIILKIEQVMSGNTEEVSLEFCAKNLEDKSCWYLFHKFKPMFYLSRTIEGTDNARVYASEPSKGVSPTWKPAVISVQNLCNGDLSRPVSFELFDSYSSGNHEFLGKFEFCIKNILESGQQEFPLTGESDKSEGKKQGSVIVKSVNVRKVYSFLDYIAGGCQINLLIAVDFTGSNINPKDPVSLHYIGKDLNQYQLALKEVSEILLHYDSDKLVPLFGFGGKINKKLSHCFPLNFNDSDPSVKGLEGIMEAYQSALAKVDLSGPTHFSAVISTAVEMAEEANVNQDNQQYFILLILTDGEIHDMRDTIDWIVRGSNSPLSIVIVGVGEDEFRNMDILDADDEPLVDSKGKAMLRDIVQFVPFRDFGNMPSALTKEVLAEIPREIVNYFRIKAIVPNKQIQPTKYDHKRKYTIDTTPGGVFEESKEIQDYYTAINIIEAPSADQDKQARKSFDEPSPLPLENQVSPTHVYNLVPLGNSKRPRIALPAFK